MERRRGSGGSLDRALGRARVLAVAAPVALALAVALQVVGAPLVTVDSPLGIVSLQFVADAERAALLVEAWGSAGRSRALVHLALDVAFPLAYATTIGGAALRTAARTRAARDAAWARLVVRAAALAAASDLIENAAMVGTVLGWGGSLAARVTVAAAVTKFSLLAVSLAVLGALVVRRVSAGRGG